MTVTDVWHATSNMNGVQTCRTDTFTNVKRIALDANVFSTYYITGLQAKCESTNFSGIKKRVDNQSEP
jgi:hypothetical protein